MRCEICGLLLAPWRAYVTGKKVSYHVDCLVWRYENTVADLRKAQSKIRQLAREKGKQ